MQPHQHAGPAWERERERRIETGERVVRCGKNSIGETAQLRVTARFAGKGKFEFAIVLSYHAIVYRLFIVSYIIDPNCHDITAIITVARNILYAYCKKENYSPTSISTAFAVKSVSTQKPLGYSTRLVIPTANAVSGCTLVGSCNSNFDHCRPHTDEIIHSGMLPCPPYYKILFPQGTFIFHS